MWCIKAETLKKKIAYHFEFNYVLLPILHYHSTVLIALTKAVVWLSICNYPIRWSLFGLECLVVGKLVIIKKNSLFSFLFSHYFTLSVPWPRHTNRPFTIYSTLLHTYLILIHFFLLCKVNS